MFALIALGFASTSHMPSQDVLMRLPARPIGAIIRTEQTRSEHFRGQRDKKMRDRTVFRRIRDYRLQAKPHGSGFQLRWHPVRTTCKPLAEWRIGDELISFDAEMTASLGLSKVRFRDVGHASRMASREFPLNPIRITYPDAPVSQGDTWRIKGFNTELGIKDLDITVNVDRITPTTISFVFQGEETHTRTGKSALRRHFLVDVTRRLQGCMIIDRKTMLPDKVWARFWDVSTEKGIELWTTINTCSTILLPATDAEIWKPIPPEAAGRGWRTPGAGKS